jgi:protein phosphatase
MMNRTIGMKSDIGKTRKVDEDSIRAETSECIIKSKMRKVRLLIVADGLGGHQNGEEASKIATETIFREWSKELSNGTPFNLILEKGIQRANQDILAYTTEHPEATGMATTSVCAIVEGNNVVLANVGDSRAYRISNDGEINRITKDHSFVQELVDQERLNKDEAREHPRKNEITKAVGLSPSLEVDTMKLTLDSLYQLLRKVTDQLLL